MSEVPLVAIIMGSRSDLETLKTRSAAAKARMRRGYFALEAARPDLKFPLTRHHFGVDAVEAQACSDADLHMGFDQRATEDIAGAGGHDPGALTPGIGAGRRAICLNNQNRTVASTP